MGEPAGPDGGAEAAAEGGAAEGASDAATLGADVAGAVVAGAGVTGTGVAGAAVTGAGVAGAAVTGTGVGVADAPQAATVRTMPSASPAKRTGRDMLTPSPPDARKLRIVMDDVNRTWRAQRAAGSIAR